MKFRVVKKGDVVDVIFPGTAGTFDEVKKIKEFVKKIGLEPRIFCEKELTLKKETGHEFPSFQASQRFEQFKKAVESDAKIIWCARGGYGSSEMTEFLRKMKKPKQQKIFIGFSDISALNKILIEDWRWQVVTAPMLAQIVLNKVSEKSTKAICDLIFGKKIELKYDLKSLTNYHPSLTAAKITGGCLSVVASQFGTKNQIDWNKKILFLEDEGETGERLDRYFDHILRISIEQKKFPCAIVLGNFLEANPHGTPKAKNIELALKRLAEKITQQKIPTALYQEKSGCLGHSKNILPVVLGSDTAISKSGVLKQKFW